jgi:thioredoxin-related protein
MDAFDWPHDTDWIFQGPLAPPAQWGKPGLIMAFNLECPGCIGRGIPVIKRLRDAHEGRAVFALLHTAYGHKAYTRDEVEPQLKHFASDFANVGMPVALDLSGDLARVWCAEGTPHWFAFDANGQMVRSLYGSQENATTRLTYLMDELTQPPAHE